MRVCFPFLFDKTLGHLQLVFSSHKGKLDLGTSKELPPLLQFLLQSLVDSFKFLFAVVKDLALACRRFDMP